MSLYFNNFETAILFTTVLVVNVHSQTDPLSIPSITPPCCYVALMLCCAYL